MFLINYSDNNVVFYSWVTFIFFELWGSYDNVIENGIFNIYFVCEYI